MNPFSFSSERVTAHIVRLTDGTNVCMYLVEGEHEALLVDTGYGLAGVREYVESLTAKRCRVVLSHGHVDHAGGASAFDQVYLNPLDAPVLARHTAIGMRRSFLAASFPCQERVLDDSDFIAPLEPGEIRALEPLHDGDVFDLGGVHVRAIHVPGHTPGMMAFLVEEERTLLIGDACGEFTLLAFEESLSVAEYLSSLQHLDDMGDLFDRVLRQHGSYESPKGIIAGNRALCDLVLDGEDDAVPITYMDRPATLAKLVDPKTMRRVDGGSGNLVYRPVPSGAR